MDDERLAQRACGAYMHPKAFPLPVHIGHGAPVEAVIVQTRFANRQHFGQHAQGQQVLQVRLAYVFIVWMHPRRGPEVRIVQSQAMHHGKFL